VRASERNGGPERELLEPGEVYSLRFANLRTGNLFAKGHRIRIVLCGSFLPHFARNLQTGESEVKSKEMRKAEIRIHHDAARPSRLVLPVVP
jgi:predicted acyl esterase